RTPLRRCAAAEPRDHRRPGRLARHPRQLPRAPLTRGPGAAAGVAAQLPGDTRRAPRAAAREGLSQGLQFPVALTAAAAACIAVLATAVPRAVPAPAQAGAGKQPATPPRSEVITEGEPVQVIRAGSGCLACPGGRLPSEAEG